ncbi:EamA family transporter [Clostridium chromiireducens]|uniref:EamA family transporter n=1 Tax=Clostridium chromiireducens TaxID=225345 RepID=A0A964RJ72_9CLOT|nr:DMT family transporter [Clostridium chromiireducens]MVX62630.1 EamA family transporter [Clostridium chromiireducens]
MKSKIIFANLMAILTILIWGTTFISTKILLIELSPEEILSYRFFIAFLVLIVIFPKNFKFLPLKEEMLFVLLGASGISLYYWTENLALKYTYASNVGLISSSIPIFTALISHFIFKNEKFTVNMLFGFIIAFIGISIVIYNGKVLRLNPRGDFMAIISAILFSVYSVLIKKVDNKYDQLLIVKKTFFYGVITMLPILFVTKVNITKVPNLRIDIILNLLFLSIFASVLCFLMWNKAVKVIGAVKTTNYIYFVPIITMISSSIVLGEKISGLMILGGMLIFCGVYVSQGKWGNNILNFKINKADNISGS